jgi:hypothetical protein
MTLDQPSLLTNETTPQTTVAARRMRSTMAAARLAFTWLGVRKSLSTEQKQQAAEPFDAEARVISASKRILDSSHPAFRGVTHVKSRAVSLWRALSLPYVETGVRLIRRDDVERFNVEMTGLRAELNDAVAKLDDAFVELKEQARERLGRLYNEGDYPTTLRGMFDLSWDHPSLEAPEYLRSLNPELFRQETERVQARFNEAVELAERAFTEELGKLVSHLAERLSGESDGKPKVFRDSAVANLRDFFERFSRLNIGSNEDLDRLVAECRQLVSGVGPQDLRDNAGLRVHVSAELTKVQQTLDELLVDKPRRAILRKPK